MSDSQDEEFRASEDRRESAPIFNVPGIVIAMIAVLGAVHFLRTEILSEYDDIWTLVNLAFIPGCYGGQDAFCLAREGWAPVLSPLTHAFLHGDWMHFGANAIWFLAFGTPVARRLGTGRFVAFMVLGALAGAAFFFVWNPALVVPMIGASGIVSALMGGACRFALGAAGRPVSLDAPSAPLLTIRRSLSDRTVLFFIIFFFVTNVALGSGAAALMGEEGAVAWEAHLGGFLFGFLCFAFFDPRHQRSVA